uniref:DNA binding protein n=1 Tax=Rhizophora mucronata TaxID=61149 RepID=A0A2P2J4B4_RHIMU
MYPFNSTSFRLPSFPSLA